MENRVIDPNNPQPVTVKTVLPWPLEDPRGMFLGFRACGYSEQEALRSVGVDEHELLVWRSDTEFADAEHKLRKQPDTRQTLAQDYVFTDWLRNLRMFLRKDYETLQDALNPDFILSKDEYTYLTKIRSQYNTQTLAALREAVSGSREDGFNWAKAVMSVANKPGSTITAREVTVKTDGQT
jgi:hypothetical protein